MKNELKINHSLEITSNMDTLAKRIQEDIEKKYSLTVTDETVTDTKKVMAEINKEKEEFKKKYKDFKNVVLEPLKPLDEKAKQIEKYYDAAREALDLQVKKFEESKRANAKEVCIAYNKKQCEAKEIDPNTIVIVDLFDKLGSLTAANCISGTAKKEIDQRIQAVENAILKERLEQEEQRAKDQKIADEARIKAEEKAEQEKADLLKKAEQDKEDAVKKALDIAKVEEENKKAAQNELIQNVVYEAEKTKRVVTFATEQECDEIFAPAEQKVNPALFPHCLTESQENRLQSVGEPAIKQKTFTLLLTKELYIKFYEFLDQNNIQFEEVLGE